MGLLNSIITEGKMEIQLDENGNPGLYADPKELSFV
jgi:hypothetical protein